MREHSDFLDIADRSREELLATLDLAARIKRELAEGTRPDHLGGKTLAMVFQKPSARTRVSFEVGMYQLGGYALYLAPTDIGLGKREAVKDIAQVLARYNDGIMARVFAHDHLLELAEYADVPVINGLSDLLHPCQVMADLLTIAEHKGRVEGLKVAFVGDGNNLANSWLNAASRLEFTLSLAIPEGYEPDRAIFDRAKSANPDVTIIEVPDAAVEGADVIYTDTWTSMGQEEESEKRRRDFQGYTVDAGLVARAADDVIVMHCLPAHRGEEITDEVMDGPHSVVFDEAENRMHAQKAVLVELMSD
jgi:ornithine carbamoyltransferase